MTHRVTAIGKNLAEIYKAVADAEARLVALARADFSDEVKVPPYKALVREIQNEPLDPDERKR